MDCVNSFVFILFCFGLLSSFIALITTGWIVYVEDSGIVQYSGLYQSCTIEKCAIDWGELSNPTIYYHTLRVIFNIYN